MDTLKKEILFCDILMWTTFVMMIAARVLTMFYISAVANETGADIEAIHTVYELSPVHKMLLNLGQMGNVLKIFVIPSMAMALYFLFRRKTKRYQVDVATLSHFVTFSFFIILLDVINNLALLLGRLV